MGIEQVERDGLFDHTVPCESVISGAGDKTGGDSQSGLVSGVARHPRKVSTLTSVPQATSAVAR